jgi:hypothetical protein
MYITDALILQSYQHHYTNVYPNSLNGGVGYLELYFT